mgnify:FL=1
MGFFYGLKYFSKLYFFIGFVYNEYFRRLGSIA